MTIDAIKKNVLLLTLAAKIRELIDAELPEEVTSEMDGDPMEDLKAMIFDDTLEIG